MFISKTFPQYPQCVKALNYFCKTLCTQDIGVSFLSLQIEDNAVFYFKILEVMCFRISANCKCLRSPGTYRHFTTCRHMDQLELDLRVLVKLAGIIDEFFIEDKIFFEVVLLEPQSTCGLDFTMSLKQI